MSQQQPMGAIANTVMEFVYADSLVKSKRIVEAHRDLLLTDFANQFLADAIEHYKDNADITDDLQNKNLLLALCRDKGIETAFAEFSSFKPVVKAVRLFFQAKSEIELQRLVESERDVLLTDTTDQIFAARLESVKGDADAIRPLLIGRVLLARCRKPDWPTNSIWGHIMSAIVILNKSIGYRDGDLSLSQI